MSVNGPKNELKLKIGFQEIFSDNNVMPDISLSISNLLKSQSDNAPKMGLEVQKDNDKNSKSEYYEDGSIKSRTFIDPKNNQPIKKFIYDEFGGIISESHYSKDEVEEIIYNPFGKAHIFKDRAETKVSSIVNYDDKNRLTGICTYNPETGRPEKDEAFNPETGKLQQLTQYDSAGRMQKASFFSDKYPNSSFLYEYSEDNKLQKLNVLDENEKITQTTVFSEETTLPQKRIFYDKEGKVSEEFEIAADGSEITPTASALKKDFSMENFHKITSENIIRVMEDYNKISPDKNLFETINNEKYPENSTERADKFNYLSNLLIEKLGFEKTNSLPLYCNDEKAINDGIQFIKDRLEQCKKNDFKGTDNVFKLASSMIRNNDYFIDVANGKIDKVNYQGKVGDCWLLAGINSIAETENGKKFLQNFISVNQETHDVTVKLDGGKSEYVISQDEILSSGELSKGDYDLRAMEIAFKRRRLESPELKKLDGGHAIEAFEILTGNPSLYANCSLVELGSQNPNSASIMGLISNEASPFNEETASQFKNKPLTVIGGNKIFEMLEKLQPNIAICANARTSETTSHQYWIKIDGDNIIVKEPHNSNNSRIYSKEEFLEKFNGGLNVLIL